MNLFKKCAAKSYSFLPRNTTLPSSNPLCLRHNFLERVKKVIMAIDEKIRDEKLQCDRNIEAA